VNWQPIHPNHAIERTRIAVQFKDALPLRTVLGVGEVFEKTRSDFGFGPRVEVQAHSIVVDLAGQGQQPVAQQSRGWQFRREAAPGAIVEALIFTPEGVVYENVEYVRWAEFWDRASRLILPLVQISAEVTDLRLFSLEYFDRFVFSGAPSMASPSSLISEGMAANLPGTPRSGAELWHLHRGWFETLNGIRVLVNQNIDANDVHNPDGEIKRSVGIYTKIERRNTSEVVDASSISSDLNKMHEISKMVVASVLMPEIRTRIGLHGNAGA
jgi:uncharacterized protein (TIGR04255 family)